MAEQDVEMRIQLFIKKKWPDLYKYHSHPEIGWENCFLKPDTVRKWKPRALKPKTFDKGKGCHILTPGRPLGAKDVNGTDFIIVSVS